MFVTSCELREKDVINICDGRRLGFICDFEIDADCGRISAVFVCERFFSISGGKNQIKICWDKIKCIGEDTVLVDAGNDIRCSDDCKPRNDKRRKNWLFAAQL